jgi:hypothetical protein
LSLSRWDEYASCDDPLFRGSDGEKAASARRRILPHVSLLTSLLRDAGNSTQDDVADYDTRNDDIDDDDADIIPLPDHDEVAFEWGDEDTETEIAATSTPFSQAVKWASSIREETVASGGGGVEHRWEFPWAVRRNANASDAEVCQCVSSCMRIEVCDEFVFKCVCILHMP